MLQRAIGATAWLMLLCSAAACAGPGLEPPGERNEDGAPVGDAGAGSGGTGATGGTGGGSPADQPGDGGGDGVDHDGSDAGEADRDAGVDDDGGTDPQELEP